MADLQLRDEIRVPDLGACVISTFNLNLQFFEQVLLPRLRSAGCRLVIVLVDERQYAKALATESYTPLLLGTAWVAAPIRSSGAFHPKFTLLLGKRESRLVIGSHNLTFAGYGGNLENTTFHRSNGASRERASIQAVWRFLREWNSDQPEGIQELLQFLESKEGWPWLKQGEEQDFVRVLGSTCSGGTLWDQVRPHLPKQVSEIVVLGPYFDAEFAFLKELMRAFPGAAITIGVQPGLTVLQNDPKRRPQGVRFCDLSQWEALRGDGSEKTKGDSHRFVHAKCLLFRSANGDGALVSGSANPSAPAWFGTHGTRNAEMVVVTPFLESNKPQLVQDILKISACDSLSEVAWSLVGQADLGIAGAGNAPCRIAISSAWLEGQTLSLHLNPSKGVDVTDIRFEDSHGALHAPGVWTEAQRIMRFEQPEGVRFAHVYLGEPPTGIRIPIFHRDQLIEAATITDSVRSLKAALLGLDDSLQGLEGNLRLIERVILDYEAGQREEPHRGHQRAQGDHAEASAVAAGDGSRVIPIHEFIQARKPRRLGTTDSLALIVDGLFYRLGQGLSDSGSIPELTDVPEGELEKIGQSAEGAEAASPEERDGIEARNRIFQRKGKALGRRLKALANQAVAAGHGATARIQQAAAVFSVLRHFARLEERDKTGAADFLDLDDLVNLWSDLIDLLLPEPHGLLWQSYEENDHGPFEEASVLLGLLIWGAYATGIDLHTTFRRLDVEENPEPYLVLEAQLAFLIDVAARDEDALHLARATSAEPKFQRWLEANLAKAHRAFSPTHPDDVQATQLHELRLGHFVLCQQPTGLRPAIVLKHKGKKCRLWAVGFDEPKEFLSDRLVRI